MSYRPQRRPRNGPLLTALTGILTATSVAHQAGALTATSSPTTNLSQTYYSTSYTANGGDLGTYGASFYAGYSLDATSGSLQVGVSDGASVVFAGTTNTVVTSSATATGSNGNADLALSLNVLGSQLVDTTITDLNAAMEVCVNNGTDIDLDNTWTFADDITVASLQTTVTFPIPIPAFEEFDITITAAAEGCAGTTLTLTSSSAENQLELVAAPTLTLGLDGSVGVGDQFAGAGLEGTINFVDVSLPMTALLQAPAPGYDVTYEDLGAATLSTLSGNLSGYVVFAGVQSSWTIFSWSGYTLASSVMFTDSIPTVTGQTVSASNGYQTAASYTYNDSNSLTDQSTFTWYQATDANGDNSTQVSTSGNTWNIMPLSSDSTNGGYAKYCVTPNNGLNAGTQQCSSWLSLGKLARLFTSSGYSGTNYNYAYQASGITNGTCFTFPSAFIDAMGSYEIYAPASTSLAYDFYNYASCGGTELLPGTITATTAGNSFGDSSLGSKHVDAANSMRIAAPDTVSASAPAITISGNTATGSYTYGGAGFTESGSTYVIQRSLTSSGASPTTLATSKTWTLVTNDNQEYLRFCVTPEDEFGTVGTQQCSGWTSVGPLVELWTSTNYGGTNLNIAYEQSADWNCFNLTDYSFNDLAESLKFFGTSTNASTLWVFMNTNCQSGNTSAETGTHTLSTNGVEDVPSMSSDYGSTWNQSVSSFMVTWD